MVLGTPSHLLPAIFLAVKEYACFSSSSSASASGDSSKSMVRPAGISTR